jgi:hypothetical protein
MRWNVVIGIARAEARSTENNQRLHHFQYTEKPNPLLSKTLPAASEQ